MPQCFIITDEYGNPVQNAKVDTIVDNAKLSTGFTNPSGTINATITPFKDNLIYVRFNSYTPIQYVYNGSGGESCISITIHTCQPLQQEKLEDGRFLIWNPVMYCVRDQTMPLEICGPDRSSDNVICDRFAIEEEEDYYALPVKNGDSIRWVMDKSEVDYDDDTIESLRIGIVKNGVMIAEDIGTIMETEDQLFCEAIIPCLIDCEYEFVIYRIDVIDYIGLLIDPPTTIGDCDGSITAVVTLGTPPYEYSLDGENWQLSDTFTGLCTGEYTVYARDSDCSQGEKKAFLDVIDCGFFQGKTLAQVIATGVTLGQIIDAGCILCDFVPIGQGFVLGPNLVPAFLSGTWGISGSTISSGDIHLFGTGAYAENTFTTTQTTIRLSIRIFDVYYAEWTVKIIDSLSSVVYTKSGTNITTYDEIISIPIGNYTIRVEKTGSGSIRMGLPSINEATNC
jgi:hypothetical protein